MTALNLENDDYALLTFHKKKKKKTINVRVQSGIFIKGNQQCGERVI